MELDEIQVISLIEKYLNISSHTVLRQLKNIKKYLKPNYFHLPERLSMDKFKSVKKC